MGNGYIPTIGRALDTTFNEICSSISGKSEPELSEALKTGLVQVEKLLEMLRNVAPDYGFYKAHYTLIKTIQVFKTWLRYWLDNDKKNMEKYKEKFKDMMDKVNRDFRGKLRITFYLR